MQNIEYGLIGKTLKHSYSKIIHNKFGKYGYDLFEIAPEDLKSFALKKELKGYNVTIPYKKEIMPYLDQISKEALDIGAVNTVVNRAGKLFGYNTDFSGMVFTLKRAGIEIKDKLVMVLGTGGAGNTAVAVCKELGAKNVVSVSRTGEINYQNCYDYSGVNVIINATPVGMYPDTEKSPVDLAKFPRLTGVMDLIYNPACTKLIYQAKELNIKSTNGLPMLVAQAKYAMDYFLDQESSDDIIEEILLELKKETQNVILIGMPSSGKSVIGRAVARALNREFIDIDGEIEKQEGKSIPQIFEQNGEGYFREVERNLTLKTCALCGKVIATGGGVVKDKNNLFSLKQNGKVILIKRDIDKLVSDGRPLSKDKESIRRLYQERKELYKLFADAETRNDGDIETAVKGVINAYENISD